MAGRDSEANVWLSYDSVAETYERVAVPWFEPMARDLVTAVGLSRGATLLDVGTGTGLVADIVRGAVGPSGFTVGIDPSLEMLKIARGQHQIVITAASVPGLPFADASFDAVLANLVISHLRNLRGGLADMARVLRRRGRLGVTAWAHEPKHDDDQSPEADRIVEQVRGECGLPSEAPVRGAPQEDRLRDRPQLLSFLADAGLHHVDASAHTYRRVFAVDDYLSGWGGLGRYLRWRAGEERWQDYSNRAATRLRQRFGNTIISVKQAWVATGLAS